MRKFSAIFLDRDGVINRKAPEGDYVKSWSEFEFLPGALEGLRMLGSLAERLIVVTNQRGVALGRMSERALHNIHEKMLAAVQEAGGRLDAVYYCPHEQGACQWPQAGDRDVPAGQRRVSGNRFCTLAGDRGFAAGSRSRRPPRLSGGADRQRRAGD